jgi:hypothetical protein
MPLIVNKVFYSQDVTIYQVLQLKQRSHFVPANISQVVRTTAPHIHSTVVFIFLYVNFVESGIGIVSNPEHNRTHQVVMLNELNKANCVNFFSTANHLFCSMIVSKLEQMG